MGSRLERLARAQGLGQTLTEAAVYDRASGQLLSGSFMDYRLPRAGDMPRRLLNRFHEVACTTNPLGVTGVGEAGATMDMPATPEKLWLTCRGLKPPLSSSG